jgi:hypothetical protein
MPDVSLTVTSGVSVSVTVSTGPQGTDAGSLQQLTVSGGTAFANGDLGYIHTDGTVRPALSLGTAVEAFAEAVCVAAGGVADGAAGTFLVGTGVVEDLTGGTPGALVYVGTTAGARTTTAPATGFSKIVGRYVSATLMKFDANPAVAPFNMIPS